MTRGARLRYAGPAEKRRRAEGCALPESTRWARISRPARESAAPPRFFTPTRPERSKFAAHVGELRIAQLSPLALRALLDHAGLSLQRTTSWMLLVA